LTSKPAGSSAALSSSTSAKPTFTADVAGTYVASLTVNDGNLSSTSVTVSITATVQLELYKVSTSIFNPTETKVAFPFSSNGSSSTSYTCVGSCSATYSIQTYKLKALGQAFTITGLTATNTTGGSTIAPTFGGLTTGLVIPAGSTVKFDLLIPRPSTGSANLSYDFNVVETGQTFHYGTVGTFNIR